MRRFWGKLDTSKRQHLDGKKDGIIFFIKMLLEIWKQNTNENYSSFIDPNWVQLYFH